MMNTIALVHHRVGDFDAWKKEYDRSASLQAESGVRGYQVLRSDDSPNDVVVTHSFDSHKAAKAYFDKPELKAAMGRAGVKAESVSITYFDEVEAGRRTAK
jgi:quinol monooxygenase YgiN